VQTNPSKTIHETYARFFEKPSRESLRELLKGHLGEHRHCDFKESWPENGSLSKHLLGLANVGGGCLVFGVQENEDRTTTAVGLDSLKDKADVFNGIKYYLPESLMSRIEIADFSFDASEYPQIIGKEFQVLFVDGIPAQIPYVARKSGTGLREGAIYTRREGVTEEASFEEINRLIADRIARELPSTQARHLLEHLEELKILYGEIQEIRPF